MEFEHIKELIKVFDKSSVSKLRFSHDSFSIELEKPVEQDPAMTLSVPKLIQQPQPVQIIEQPSYATETPVLTEQAPQQKGELVTSPMVGTIYKAPSPDSAPYVRVGDTVAKGQPLAIIEAMKIMNEIEAEFDCKILEILVDDGQPVEYDMPLFRVEKA